MRKRIMYWLLVCLLTLGLCVGCSNQAPDDDSLDRAVQEYFEETYNTDMAVTYRRLADFGEWTVVYAEGAVTAKAEVTRVIAGYEFHSPNTHQPYDLGLYVTDGVTVWTLEEAAERSLVDVGEISRRWADLNGR